VGRMGARATFGAGIVLRLQAMVEQQPTYHCLGPDDMSLCGEIIMKLTAEVYKCDKEFPVLLTDCSKCLSHPEFDMYVLKYAVI